LAGGARVECPYYELFIEWEGEPRLVQVLALDGNPLLGTLLMEGSHLEIELTEGGQVALGPL
jgi:hypothetical protein